MNFSIGWMKLACLANDRVVVHKDLIERYFPRAPGFSRTNLRKNHEQKDMISTGPTLDFLPDPTTPHPPKIEAPP